MPALELTLPQIASLEADGTIAFHANRISTIASAPQAFMIFYLTQADEQNGYGTVIQLDEQKKAFIYPDLNPEYTYLFFQNEQGFQTLLWCIEFATRTPEGLYVTQAKTHGRGVTEADMQRFSQIALPGNPPTDQSPPAPQHALAEEYTPAAPAVDPTTSIESTSAVTAPAQPSIPANVQMPAEPMTQTPVAPPQPTPIFEPASSASELNLSGMSEPPLATAPNITPLPNLPPLSPPPAEPAPYSTPQPTFTAPLPDLPPMAASPDANLRGLDLASQPTAEPMLDLPPLPPMPASPNQSLTEPPITPSAAPIETPTPKPIAAPLAEPAAPVYQAPQPAPEPPLPTQTAAKNPVGRPPKPLMTDTSWQVDQADFSWAKNISRESITTFQPELRQKVEQQIQLHQPELLANPVFVDSFNHAFNAVCQTYELVPTARQDLLRSLLNGRIVENVLKTLPQS